MNKLLSHASPFSVLQGGSTQEAAHQDQSYQETGPSSMYV